MGYRSDVAYIIRVEGIDKAKEFIALIRLKGGYVFEGLKECSVSHFTDRQNGTTQVDFNFYDGDVKWYDGYEDVQGHNELLAFVEDEFNECAGYRFIRIGEDNEDIETRTGGNDDLDPWDDFYVHRSINIPFSYENGGVGEKITELDRLIGDKQ